MARHMAQIAMISMSRALWLLLEWSANPTALMIKYWRNGICTIPNPRIRLERVF